MTKVNKTTDTDKGASRIIGEAKKTNGSYVDIGVHSDAGDHESDDLTADLVTIAEVAFWNEYGTSNIPERSFIRATIDANRKRLERETQKLYRKVVDGKIDTKKALDMLGLRIQEMIKQTILEQNDPPNAPSTVERKGFNNPLVDSRQLWRSIAYKSTVTKSKGGK
jgi:hypothetical protein